MESMGRIERDFFPQIPQYTGPMSKMHHFVTEMCTCVHISDTKWCIVGYLSFASWDLWDGSTNEALSHWECHNDPPDLHTNQLPPYLNHQQLQNYPHLTSSVQLCLTHIPLNAGFFKQCCGFSDSTKLTPTGLYHMLIWNFWYGYMGYKGFLQIQYLDHA